MRGMILRPMEELAEKHSLIALLIGLQLLESLRRKNIALKNERRAARKISKAKKRINKQKANFKKKNGLN